MQHDQLAQTVNFACPICLFPLVQPITLTCGHNQSFCQPCIRNIFFQMSHSSCPLCRAPIINPPRSFKINTLLDAIIQQQFNRDDEYNERLTQLLMQKKRYRRSRIRRILLFISLSLKSIWRFMQKLYNYKPYEVLMFLLVYTIKQTVINRRLKVLERVLGDEIGKIISVIKKQASDTNDFNKEKSIDMQDLVFSKLVKYLFTSFVRF